ncbi:MAG: SDR family NAD(P)-dependent oxidoreductase [Clostridia bacterium]|nr:SDR family NAD(P)-dependent oxidoreductase [Clostridia bacterium]
MENKSILITGAGGSLGAAAVRAFLERGYTVFAADIDVKSVPEGAVPVCMDVTSAESVRAAGEELGKSCEGLWAIIHLAGLYTMDSFIEIEEDALERMLEVNLMGAYRVDRELLPLVRRGNGRIIITASELAPLDPLPFNGVYTVTKRALDGYAHSLAMELGLIGVRVITVYPGAFGDGMTKGAIRAMDAMGKKTKLYPGVTERFRGIVVSNTGKPKPPEKLAGFLVKIAEKKRPRFRYFINNSLKLKLFSALPACAQAYLLRKLLN